MHHAQTLSFGRSRMSLDPFGDSIERVTEEKRNARQAMSNAEDIESTYEGLDEAVPAPDADGVAGPVSEPPELVTSKQLKEGAGEARNKAREEEEESKGMRGRDSAPESLSSTIVFSVAVVAVVGAVIAITKKLRET